MDKLRQKVLAATIALLIPLATNEVMRIAGNQFHLSLKTVFYLITALGAIILTMGIKTTVPSLTSGLFFGGVLTIANNYRLYWRALEPQLRMVTLLSTLAVAILIALYKAGKLNEITKKRSTSKKKPRTTRRRK